MRTKPCENFKIEPSVHLSKRELEEIKLMRETNGIFAPAKPGGFFERRRLLVEQHIKEGLDKFDKEQIENDNETLNVIS
jgi:hypothetical protein